MENNDKCKFLHSVGLIGSHNYQKIDNKINVCDYDNDEQDSNNCWIDECKSIIKLESIDKRNEEKIKIKQNGTNKNPVSSDERRTREDETRKVNNEENDVDYDSDDQETKSTITIGSSSSSSDNYKIKIKKSLFLSIPFCILKNQLFFHDNKENTTSYVNFDYEKYCNRTDNTNIDYEYEEHKFLPLSKRRNFRSNDTGLSRRSRALKRFVKPCTIDVYKMTFDDLLNLNCLSSQTKTYIEKLKERERHNKKCRKKSKSNQSLHKTIKETNKFKAKNTNKLLLDKSSINNKIKSVSGDLIHKNNFINFKVKKSHKETDKQNINEKSTKLICSKFQLPPTSNTKTSVFSNGAAFAANPNILSGLKSKTILSNTHNKLNDTSNKKIDFLKFLTPLDAHSKYKTTEPSTTETKSTPTPICKILSAHSIATLKEQPINSNCYKSSNCKEPSNNKNTNLDTFINSNDSQQLVLLKTFRTINNKGSNNRNGLNERINNNLEDIVNLKPISTFNGAANQQQQQSKGKLLGDFLCIFKQQKQTSPNGKTETQTSQQSTPLTISKIPTISRQIAPFSSYIEKQKELANSNNKPNDLLSKLTRQPPSLLSPFKLQPSTSSMQKSPPQLKPINGQPLVYIQSNVSLSAINKQKIDLKNNSIDLIDLTSDADDNIGKVNSTIRQKNLNHT